MEKDVNGKPIPENESLETMNDLLAIIGGKGE